MNPAVSVFILFCLTIPMASVAKCSTIDIDDTAVCHMNRQIFDQLAAGMSVDAVAALAGCGGDHTASYNTASGHADIYTWGEEEDDFASVLFENGILTSKRQRGLH